MDKTAWWDSELQMGSSTIDNQHNLLTKRIEDINNLIKAGTDTKILFFHLSILLNHALQHFEIEEEYFKKHPEHNRCCLENYQMVKNLNAFIAAFRNKIKNGNQEQSSFLDTWIQDHIRQYNGLFVANEIFNLSLMTEAEQAELSPDFTERRRHKRIHREDVVDGEVKVLCYNATQKKNGTATIVDMSTGGLMLMTSSDTHRIDDLLVVTCSIGAIFKMKESVKVRRASDKIYGVEFISPSPETMNFFTNLYGAVHLRK